MYDSMTAERGKNHEANERVRANRVRSGRYARRSGADEQTRKGRIR